MIDQYKDIVYLYRFKHHIIALFALVHSISYPFALFCQLHIGVDTFGFLHSAMVFYHITSTKLERFARNKFTSVVALNENLTQFLVQMFEVVLFRNSVNFLQSFIPIFTLCMSIYSLAPTIGRNTFDLLILRNVHVSLGMVYFKTYG